MTTIREKIRAAIGDQAPRATDYELAILHGLQTKPTYQGTVDPAVVADRRRRNRAARRSRRGQRPAVGQQIRRQFVRGRELPVSKFLRGDA